MRIERFQVGSLWTNCYVVAGENGEALVIDPGGPMGDVRRFITDNGLRVKQILLTHGHSDHIMGLKEIRDIASGGVAVHPEDADCVTDPSKNLSAVMGSPFQSKASESALRDGDVIRAGDLTAKVIHTPGHTRGGCCFYVSEGGDALLISGDTLFARSVGRTDLPGGDEETLLESLKKLDGFPDSLPVYPGHGPSTTLGEERRLNPFWPR
ncbi:MAG: MBL fold metallo-hydrolase [Synergistaceae bacterium]|jgi:glyoxylase-like metal-dependent hydrolase (beta-lactamase superfamily II)|nr:MBL fold metallo-hydrolase [Synergistaceae bacterium]